MKATLQDVADRANVHRSTVSLALRDHPRISEPVRRKIKNIAKRLDYRINPLVSALMQSRRSGRAVRHLTLAFVTNYPTRFGWRPEAHDRPNFFPGASERAKDFGYGLQHFWMGEPGMTSKRFCDILTVRGIHGLLIGRLPPGQSAMTLAWERFSSVALGMTLRSPLLHHVTENHFDTAWESMRQSAARGYLRPGFVFSEADDSPRVGERWLSAYRGYQLNLPEVDRIPPCPKSPTDESTFREWFKKWRPDAILTNHSPPVVRWLESMGKQVPRDVGLIELEEHKNLGCAGVYYDPNKIGALAVEMLIGLLHRNEKGVPTDQHEVMLTGEWYEGKTLPDRLNNPAHKSR